MTGNLFANLPTDLSTEAFSDIVNAENVRVERIVSFGHHSEADFWYDQDEHEWVLIVEGYGEVEYDDGRTFALNKGDHLLIPKHQKHRVNATASGEHTIWLAVFFN
jgi:cupin 2 domain-containing protein